MARTRPWASSSTSARCTVRWLSPKASASAEVDQGAPSDSSASKEACCTIDRWHQQDHLPIAQRREHETARRGLDTRQRPDQRTQATDLHPQTGPVRFVGMAGPEYLRDQAFAVHFTRPGLGQHTRQREQHGSARQRTLRGGLRRAFVRRRAQCATTGVDHQCARRQQVGHFAQPQRHIAAGVDASGRRPVEHGVHVLYLRQQGRHTRAPGRGLRTCQRRLRGADTQGPQRQFGCSEFGHGHWHRRHACEIDLMQRLRGRIQPAQQQLPAHRNQLRLQRIGVVAVGRQGLGRGQQRPGRSLDVPHRQCHFGLGHDTAGACQCLVAAEAARSPLQQCAGTRVFAQLGHGDAPHGQRRRVFAQGDPVEGTQGVSGCEGSGGSGNQGVDGQVLSACAFACRQGHANMRILHQSV